jgi:hypothetical protein
LIEKLKEASSMDPAGDLVDEFASEERNEKLGSGRDEGAQKRDDDDPKAAFKIGF